MDLLRRRGAASRVTTRYVSSAVRSRTASSPNRRVWPTCRTTVSPRASISSRLVTLTRPRGAAPRWPNNRTPSRELLLHPLFGSGIRESLIDEVAHELASGARTSVAIPVGGLVLDNLGTLVLRGWWTLSRVVGSSRHSDDGSWF